MEPAQNQQQNYDYQYAQMPPVYDPYNGQNVAHSQLGRPQVYQAAYQNPYQHQVAQQYPTTYAMGQPVNPYMPQRTQGRTYSAKMIRIVNSVTPIHMECPNCGLLGITKVSQKPGVGAYAGAAVCCLLGCYLCCWIPCVIDQLKTTSHYCRGCSHLLAKESL